MEKFNHYGVEVIYQVIDGRNPARDRQNYIRGHT